MEWDLPKGVVEDIEQCWKDLKSGVQMADVLGDGSKLPAEDVANRLLAHIVWYTGALCSIRDIEEVLGDRLRSCAVRTEWIENTGTFFYVTEIMDGKTVEARADVEVLTFLNFKSVMQAQKQPALLTYSRWAVELAERAKAANRGLVATGYRRMSSELRRKYVGLGEYNHPEDGWHIYHLRFPHAVTMEDLQWHLKSH